MGAGLRVSVQSLIGLRQMSEKGRGREGERERGRERRRDGEEEGGGTEGRRDGRKERRDRGKGERKMYRKCIENKLY